MLRKLALYAWLLLVAALIIFTLVRAEIIVSSFTASIPEQLPSRLVLGFWGVFLALSALNIYLISRGTPEGRASLDREIELAERRKREARRNR